MDCVDGHMSPVECVGQLLESIVGLYAMSARSLRDYLVSRVVAVAGGPGVDVWHCLVRGLVGSFGVGVVCSLGIPGCAVVHPLSVSAVCLFRSCALWMSYEEWWVCAGGVFSVLFGLYIVVSLLNSVHQRPLVFEYLPLTGDWFLCPVLSQHVLKRLLVGSMSGGDGCPDVVYFLATYVSGCSE